MKSKAQKPAAKAGKTPKQISAHEYRDELHYLRFIMEKTRMAPDEIAEGLKRVAEPREGDEFLQWLKASPASVATKSDISAQLEIELDMTNWIQLEQFATRWDISLEDAIYSILSFALDNGDYKKMGGDLYGMKPGPNALVEVEAEAED